jgi:hypothetical protein
MRLDGCAPVVSESFLDGNYRDGTVTVPCYQVPMMILREYGCQPVAPDGSGTPWP